MHEPPPDSKQDRNKGLDLTSFLMLAFVLVLPFGFYFITKYFPQKQKSEYGLLQSILLGNKRFAHGSPVHPHMNTNYIRSISKAQHPKAIIVACSDSRVSPELIFDEGLGDLFVIRTAGNMVGELELGSIEYAVEHLGVNLIIVIGHERCGAVKAFVDNGEYQGHIKSLVDSLKNERELKGIKSNDPNLLDKCIHGNIAHTIHVIQEQSEIVTQKTAAHQLQLLGAYYDLDSGEVSIVKQ